jgi:hypothetical protein
MQMGKPTKFISLTEDEWDRLEKVTSRYQLMDLMIEIMDRNVAEMEVISRARQLQDSQLRAAESFDTSRKKGQRIH